MSRRASAAYTLCFLVASVVSVRRSHKAEPFGIRSPFSVPVDVVLGVGTGLAAPWPLIVALWRSQGAATRAGQEGRRATARLACLCVLFLTGAVAEPVSHRLRTGGLHRDEALLVALNLSLPVGILYGALRSLADERSDRSPGGSETDGSR